MDKITAYHIADFIDIKNLKPAINAKLIYSDSVELFYQTENLRFIYIFRYGAISFLNYDNKEISDFMEFLNKYCRNVFGQSFSDELLLEAGAPENKISHNKVEIRDRSPEVIRMVMLNVSQSVTLDYYSNQTELLLEETNYHTQLLEKKGKLAISGKNLKKFIGKTLMLKNRIAENLYIFDSPPETWENEELDKLHNDLKKSFDLQDRFRDVSEGLSIVKDNLELFKDILHDRNSVLLEWIVIILIGIEILNFFLDKLF